jgi:hypothetical protein
MNELLHAYPLVFLILAFTLGIYVGDANKK